MPKKKQARKKVRRVPIIKRKFQDYLRNGPEAVMTEPENEYVLEVASVAGSATTDRIIIRTFNDTLVLSLLLLEFAERRKAVELLLKEIQAAPDQTARFLSVMRHCTARIAKQSHFKGFLITVGSASRF